jgi:hypothetical protein
MREIHCAVLGLRRSQTQASLGDRCALMALRFRLPIVAFADSPSCKSYSWANP